MKKGQICASAEKRRRERWQYIQQIMRDGGTIDDALKKFGWKNRAVARDFLCRHGTHLMKECGVLPHNSNAPRMLYKYMSPVGDD